MIFIEQYINSLAVKKGNYAQNIAKFELVIKMEIIYNKQHFIKNWQ